MTPVAFYILLWDSCRFFFEGVLINTFRKPVESLCFYEKENTECRELYWISTVQLVCFQNHIMLTFFFILKVKQNHNNKTSRQKKQKNKNNTFTLSKWLNGYNMYFTLNLKKFHMIKSQLNVVKCKLKIIIFFTYIYFFFKLVSSTYEISGKS